VRSALATRALEPALFLGLTAPLLAEWVETTSASSRLSYALLVPGLALGLAWRAKYAAKGDAWVGDRLGQTLAALAAALAGLVLLGGALSGVFTLSLLALPMASVAYSARTFGARGLQALAPALALAFLMVPPPMPLLDRINPFLVEASGTTAVTLLRPFDAAAGWSGATLTFRGWELIVADACSGSGTFLMLGALSAFLAALFRLRPPGTLLLLALSLPVTLLVNGLRIASSALVIERFGAAAGQGLAHELLGQAVVIVGAAALVLAVERTQALAARWRSA
jgi:exosortase